MARFSIQQVILIVVICSKASHAVEVSGTYKLQVNATGSKVCAIDMPSIVIPMALRAMRIQCGGQCNETPSCRLFQLKEEMRECELYNYSPSNFAAVDHCTAYASPSRAGVSLIPTVVAQWNGASDVLATALLNGQLFVTCDTAAKVNVRSTATFQLLRTITFTGLGTTLYGLATSAIDNFLYVSDYHNSNVHRVDLSVNNAVSVVTWSVPGNPRGLSVTSQNTVLVAINNIISEYTPSGSIVRTITTGHAYPWQPVQVSTTEWAFSCTSGHVCITSPTTGIDFGCTYMVGPGLTITYPTGMAIDTRGNMIVADRGLNMLLITPTLTAGSQLQLPVTAALQYPMAVSYDQSQGRLYVGEHGGTHRVIVYDVTTKTAGTSG